MTLFRILTDEPRNTELVPDALALEPTPNAVFYERSHGPVPNDVNKNLKIIGTTNERTLSLMELQQLPPRTLTTTLECAGNGRTFLHPAISGTPFLWGGVSTARWTGVPLAAVIAAAELPPEALELVFWGADHDAHGEPYGRSLSLGAALHEDVLLVYAMNEQPLPPNHGGPLRLLVPGWYGMASVKWLQRIEVVDAPFTGYYQTTKYRYRQTSNELGEAVATIRVRSLWAYAPDTVFVAGRQAVQGVAWSGAAAIASVECSADNGVTWTPATLAAAPRTSWQRWTWHWDAQPGPATLVCRATDALGNTQPLEQWWNVLGYGNNMVQRLPVLVQEETA